MRAIWMLEETGVKYERVLIDIREPGKARDPVCTRTARPAYQRAAAMDEESI